jgi:hypothetical protein
MSNGYVNAGQVALNTAGGLQGLRDKRQRYEMIEEQRLAQDQGQQQRQAALEEGAQLLQGEDPLALSQWALKNPDLRKNFVDAISLQDEFASRPRVALAKEVLSGRGDARGAYQERIMEIESKGADASRLKEAVDTMTDEELMGLAKKDLAMFDPKAYESFSKASGSSSGRIGTVSPKDFTVESLAEYEKTGNVGDLQRYRPKTVKIAGVEHQQDPVTLEWKPVVDLTGEDISEQAAAGAEIEADKQSRLDFAKQKSAWNAGKSKFKTRIASSRAAHKRLENTGKLIKENLNRWTTTYGANLKGLSGTDARKLEGLINSLKAHSAFSTLTDLKESGGTLGAISAPELTLLEAKLGTLDQRGDIEEQARVVDQIISANQGSIDRLEAAYADDNQRYSGNYDQSLGMGTAEPTEKATPTAEAPQGAIDYLMSNPQVAEQFRAKYGYLPEGF